MLKKVSDASDYVNVKICRNGGLIRKCEGNFHYTLL